MKNPFEAPKAEIPKEDESVDVDLSDLESAAVEGGTRMETQESIRSKHDALGRELASERETEEAGYRAVIDGFFAKNPFLKARFAKDPEALGRFKEGLIQLAMNRSRTYQTEIGDLPSDPRFQQDLAVFSMRFEDEEAARKSSGRRAA